MNEIAEKVAKKIGKFNVVDIMDAMADLQDHPMYAKDLLYCIQNKDHEDIGKSLMMYLFKHTQEEVENE